MGLFSKGPKYIYTLEIHGMRCNMCESHVNDVIRRNFDIKSVKSSHLRNQTVIVAKSPLDVERMKEVIAATGYELKGIKEDHK